jgi:sirohydrochlorin ferrochelatase
VHVQARVQHRGWDIKSKGGIPYEWDVLLAVAHGTRNPAGVRTVSQIADALRASVPFLEVGVAFIELTEPDVATALAGIPADRRAVLVPLLLSSGYHDRVDVAASIAAARPGTPHAPVLGPDPRLAIALADRLREAGWRPGDAVVLAAAGSSDPAAIESVRTQADLLALELGTEVTVGFGSAAAPDVPAAVAAARATGAERVAIAPYLLAPGHFADRLAAAGADLVAAPLGAHPAVVELVLDRASSTDD